MSDPRGLRRRRNFLDPFLLASSARLFLGMVHGTVSSNAVHLQQPVAHRRADMVLTDKRYVSRLFGRWRKKMSLAGDHLSTSSKAHLVSPRHFQEKPIVLPAKWDFLQLWHQQTTALKCKYIN